MEIFELRYFLAVAREEHLHRASDRLRVSPAALSKAISRLEAELGKKLFLREGRRIRLSDEGKLLQRRAHEIIKLEETTRTELVGGRTALHAEIAGSEILLSGWGPMVCDQIRGRYPGATFELLVMEEHAALGAVQRGEVHFSLTSSDVPAGLRSRKISDVTFRTCVGEGHPLYESARQKKTVPIDIVLEHGFASPDRPFLGRTRPRQSLDGWRDDAFPRRIEYVVSSLKLLETLVTQGRILAYLPDYYARTLRVLTLDISGCPYSCKQTVKLVAPESRSTSWINQVF